MSAHQLGGCAAPRPATHRAHRAGVRVGQLAFDVPRDDSGRVSRRNEGRRRATALWEPGADRGTEHDLRVRRGRLGRTSSAFAGGQSVAGGRSTGSTPNSRPGVPAGARVSRRAGLGRRPRSRRWLRRRQALGATGLITWVIAGNKPGRRRRVSTRAWAGELVVEQPFQWDGNGSGGKAGLRAGAILAPSASAWRSRVFRKRQSERPGETR